MQVKSNPASGIRPPRAQIVEDVKQIVGEQMGIPRDTIRESDHLINDLGSDSLDVEEISMEVEEHFGVTVKCYMNDPGVMERAQKNGTTRAKAAVDAAVSDGQDGIYVIGNAPTAQVTLSSGG